MPYIRLGTDSTVANSTALAQLGATASAAINTDWLAELSLYVTLPAGHGGLKFNLRMPAGSFGALFEPFRAAADGMLMPAVGIPWAGIAVNVGTTPQDALMWDPPGAWSGVIHGQWGVRLGATAGSGIIEVARVRTGSAAPVIKTGSMLTLRAP